MFGSTVLEIAIGLMFIYLVLSLVCSKLNEYIVAHWLSWRADTLEHAVLNLLGDEALKTKLYDHPLIHALKAGQAKPNYIPSHLFSLALLDLVDGATNAQTNFVRGSGSNRTGTASVDTPKSKEDGDISPPSPPLAAVPAAVAAETPVGEGITPASAPAGAAAVAPVNTPVGKDLDAIGQQIKTLTDALSRSPLPSNVTRALSIFATEAEADTDKIRKNVEGWFNETMERASGAYKRKTQMVILVIALFAVILANADTIMIVNQLSHQSTLRLAATAAADQIVHQPKTGDVPTLDAKQLGQLDMVVGWSSDPQDIRHFPGYTKQPGSDVRFDGNTFLQELPMKLIGLLITTFAVAMGAPFWFDLLGKIVTMRNAGRNPTEPPKNQAKTPPATDGNR